MGKQWKQWQTFFFGSKITADGDCSHEIKTCFLLEEKLWQTRQHIKKQRHYFSDKSPYSQSYGFSTRHVWMWELDHKEIWASKNWCYWTVVLEKTLESPLDCKEVKPVNPKGNQSWLEELMLKLKVQYFGHPMRTDSLEKTLMLGKIEGRRRRGWQRMRCLNAISDSMDMSLSKETWHAEVHRASKSQTWLSDWTVLNWTMKDDVLISIFSLLQKQLFREWGTWIYEVGFLISEKDLRRIYKWNFYCKCHDLKTTESFIIIHIPYHL